MARPHPIPSPHAALVLSALLAALPAFGQNGAAPGIDAAPMPAPFSRDCQQGGAAITEQSPLPRVAANLAAHKPVKILAIGA